VFEQLQELRAMFLVQIAEEDREPLFKPRVVEVLSHLFVNKCPQANQLLADSDFVDASIPEVACN